MISNEYNNYFNILAYKSVSILLTSLINEATTVAREARTRYVRHWCCPKNAVVNKLVLLCNKYSPVLLCVTWTRLQLA